MMQAELTNNAAAPSTQARGFSLVELLLVMAIIGLLATSVSLTLPVGDDVLVEREARALEQKLAYAKTYAVSRQVTLGFRVESPAEYRFVLWESLDAARAAASSTRATEDGRGAARPASNAEREYGLGAVQSEPAGRWVRFERSGFDNEALPEDVTLTLESAELRLLEQDERLEGGLLALAEEASALDIREENLPHILIFPTGETSVFTFALQSLTALDATWYLQSFDGHRMYLNPERLEFAPELNDDDRFGEELGNATSR